MRINDIIIKPHVTEKAVGKSKATVYSFEVALLASKDQVRNAVQELFSVKVDKVRTVVRKGKIKRAGRKMLPKQRPDRKIAYVTVKEGTISVFPQA